jgi:hypothetical protein
MLECEERSLQDMLEKQRPTDLSDVMVFMLEGWCCSL